MKSPSASPRRVRSKQILNQISPMHTPIRLILAAQLITGVASAALEVTPFLNHARNNAIAGTASQSTTDFGGLASFGNNGLFNGAFPTTHTNDPTGGTAFWQVDLGSTQAVDQIVLWNRLDCCGERLTNFRVSVLDGADIELWGQNFYTGGGNVGVNEIINPPVGTAGNKVKVGFLPGTDQFLALAEVEVLDLSTAPFANVALGKVATQSTDGYGGTPDRAVDGNTSGRFGDNSVTHTADTVVTGSPVFWEVDLAGDFDINEIALYNRTDCCDGRLSNYRLSVFDGAAEIWGADYFVGAGSAKSIFSVHDDAGGFFAQGDRVRIEYLGGLNNEGDSGGGKSLSLAEVQVFGQAIPEPGAFVSLAGGIGMLIALRRRRV